MTHRQNREAAEKATGGPLSAERSTDGASGADTRDRPPGGRTADPTETLARALAAAEHINPCRDTGPWDDLTPEQQDQFRAEAARATNPEETR